MHRQESNKIYFQLQMRKPQRMIMYLQNLFCNLTWCLQTLSPPPGSGNEALLHPPLREGQILKDRLQRPKFIFHTIQIIPTGVMIQITTLKENKISEFSWLTLWMVDKRGDPEVGDFGDQFWPLLKEWLTKFVVFLFYFEDLLACLLVQPGWQK